MSNERPETRNEEPEVILVDPDPEAERFYGGIYDRLGTLTPILGAVISIGLLAVYGWRVGLGFALGGVIGVINFWLLKRGVAKLADRVTGQGSQVRGARIVFGFFFRYILLGAAVYGILVSSAVSLLALFAGLFLPIVALLLEAGYELYAALRHKL